MSYESFQRDFLIRSLQLVKEYDGPHDASILLNCLLGLLIFPSESEAYSLHIPTDPITDWGISHKFIRDFGSGRNTDDDARTVRGFVLHLRNALSHNLVEPIPDSGVVQKFYFQDDSGFEAAIPLEQLKNFVERLTETLTKLLFP